MFPYLPIPPIDPFSFWVGFLAGILLVWLVSKIRPLAAQIVEGWKKQQEAAQMRRSSSLEEHHLQNTLRQAQGMHLAAPLFSLDEILITPRLLAPPPYLLPGEPPLTEDIVTHSLPYLPAWPELAAIYRAPTLSLSEALASGMNLAFAGQPGSGKTVTLAYLASLIARRDPQAGALQEAIPFLVHVADLSLPASETADPLTPITNAIAEHAPLLDLPRLPNFAQYVFSSGKACLLLDGLDELPQSEIVKYIAYLGALLKTYPNTRAFVTICPEYVDGLHALGFKTLTLLPWERDEQWQFLQRWGELWDNFIAREAWAQSELEMVDPLLLNAWLESDNAGLTPLEITLKAWAAYAGDSRGPSVLNHIESHLRRLAPSDVPPAALEALAMQVILTSQPVFNSHNAREWVREFEPPEEKVEIEEKTQDGQVESAEANKATAQAAPPSPGFLPKMADSGLLSRHPNNRMRFCHIVFGGYLAGGALSLYKDNERLCDQPVWTGQVQAMRFLAARGNPEGVIDKLLASSRPPLEQDLLLAARCLRDAPRQAPWRGKVMAALATLLQTEGLPLALRGQAVAALVLSRDPGAPILFRQLLQSLSPTITRLAALGSGALQDQKAIETLTQLLRTSDFYVRRAACLALVAIDTSSSLEAVATSLLSGDEDLQRTAAEALANHPKEGYAALKDGITLDNILVRRASAYGLGRIKEAWALEALQKAQVDDEQWIVRNAAAEMTERLTSASPYLPRRLTPPSETPWLITFAGTQGMGISPGAPATDILLLVLKHGTLDERLAVLPYLAQEPTEGTIRSLYEVMYGAEEPEMSEAAFQVLWEIAASGVELPEPQQFGLG